MVLERFLKLKKIKIQQFKFSLKSSEGCFDVPTFSVLKEYSTFSINHKHFDEVGLNLVIENAQNLQIANIILNHVSFLLFTASKRLVKYQILILPSFFLEIKLTYRLVSSLKLASIKLHGGNTSCSIENLNYKSLHHPT